MGNISLLYTITRWGNGRAAKELNDPQPKDMPAFRQKSHSKAKQRGGTVLQSGLGLESQPHRRIVISYWLLSATHRHCHHFIRFKPDIVMCSVDSIACRSVIPSAEPSSLDTCVFHKLLFNSEDFYGSDTSLCNHWPFALEPTPSFLFYSILFTNWWAKCLFSFSQDCSLLSGSLALEALLIGVHCKKRYINV